MAPEASAAIGSLSNRISQIDAELFGEDDAEAEAFGDEFEGQKLVMEDRTPWNTPENAHVSKQHRVETQDSEPIGRHAEGAMNLRPAPAKPAQGQAASPAHPSVRAKTHGHSAVTGAETIVEVDRVSVVRTHVHSTGTLSSTSGLHARKPTSALNAAMKSNQEDAPACDGCGSITVRSGTCYKCLNCGASMGCS